MFVSIAFAQTAGGAAGGMDIMGMLPLVLLFVLLYFLMIRPQAKKQKEHKTMLEALQKGDEVVAGGGVLGKVINVGEQFVTIEVSSGIEVLVQKPAVQTVLPKGTLKSAST
ncbi:MAG: preprotein translocase subunit YajC [Burkholderiales bacterium]|nr:preprotein translocase subunit YajC [Burkholderiales bacterium]OUT77647.1 MAG: preprotein translocase subunit YajC [Betaproteobacteria bacterium TMED22]|tara:strand:+ start:4133 stop:4465 length:333 start_codon:yes stop_codon:yes gene_type:complete